MRQQRETWHARRKHLRIVLSETFVRYVPMPFPATMNGEPVLILDPTWAGQLVRERRFSLF